jgi:Leucine-rich repeat (LRR) protein
MSSTKSRARTNATTQMIEAASPSQLITNITSTINASSAALQQQQQYVPSLLKIESVVPTRLNATRNMQRANRLMTRSYSTLCGPTSITTAIPVPSAAAAYANGLVNYKNVTRKINTNLHRHKNNHHQNYHQPQQQQNERHESPTSKVNNHQQANDTTNVIVENGVHKVRRTAREREKQPDRINLDRRGLCTIPIIDNEPSLRLLSLQHNLINTFHIPDCDVSLELSSSDGVKDNNNNVPLAKDVAPDIEKPNPVLGSRTIASAAKPLMRQKSRNQLNLNFSANNNAMVMNGTAKPNGSVIVTPTTSFLQKSFMFQGKSGILKRANSVMINYSPTQTPPGASPVSIQQSSIFGPSQRGKLIATPSFSLIDGNIHHDTALNVSNNNNVIGVGGKGTPELQIDANNIYMSSFRFNLSNLVFLDLYNNQIEKISNLDGLKSLTVLLLGKNRIADITGIISLKQTLRVLDLHGNRITHITQKICQLQELKSLNLAGNLLRQIQPNDFAGLCCLKELNLKRNRIKKINVSDDLHNLER